MGERLLAKYVVKDELRAAPGYVRVFRATQTGLERDVELRLLPRPAGDLGSVFKRFRTEVQSLSRLDHPAIARVLDVGYTPTYLFYTTEYRDAVSLETLLTERGGPLPFGQVLSVARSVGSALAHCHDHGILHRNVSTETVRWDRSNDRPYVAEFSVVKDLEASSLATSLPGPIQLIATPELLSGRTYDALTDLFLFGAMLYRVATGQSPLPPMKGLVPGGGGFSFDIQRPSSRQRDLPAWFDVLVLKLLAQEPGARWPTAAAFLEALERARRAAGTPPSSASMPRPSGLAPYRPRSAVERLPDSASAPPTRRWRALAGLALAGVAGLLLFALQPPGPQPAPGLRELEDQVRLVARTLGASPVTPHNFLSRWRLFRALVVARPPEGRAGLATPQRLDELKRRFYQDPAGACRELEASFRAVP